MPDKSKSCFNIKGEPLTEYNSESDAEKGADYAKNRYGHILNVYRCSKCGKWHLSPTKKSGKCFTKKGIPLIEYDSEADAKEGIIHAKKNYDSDLIPYKCSKCGKWHLSPRNRQTPSTTCYFCLDSEGNTKELYETEEIAEQRAKIIEEEQGIELRIYPCPYGLGYHLTKDIYGGW